MKIFFTLILALLLFTACKDEAKSTKNSGSADKTANVDDMAKDVKDAIDEKAKELTDKAETVKADAEKKVDEAKADAEEKIADTEKKVDEAKDSLGEMKSGNFKIACGKCVFKDADCTECTAYVQFAGKTYPVKGVNIDIKQLGLCKTTAQADMKGHMKDNTFTATSAENIKLNAPDVKDAVDGLKKINF